ncbi:MIZ zinc finger domain containing protein [Babesia ovis]|uniref:MIZ zinc finger domain containing protein n=1 Tax=Babesia ovis TaxID=5869 RepID=A0A9W5TEK6_BABOV|nr:MIZ zinc finger domain containing protein [Babesia ovis]
MSCNTKNTNDYTYCICSGCHVDSDNTPPLKCKTCTNLSHRTCTCYRGADDDFECSLCRLHLLDPFNHIVDFLWYDRMGSKTANFKINIPDIEKWEAQDKDLYVVSLPLSKNKLVHEWPKTLELKINNEMVHRVKEPNWGHSRKDNPIKITYAIQPGENLFEICSNTYEENTPLFLIVITVSKRVTIERMMDNIKKRRNLSFEDSKKRIIDLINNQGGDDEVICIEKGYKIELNCPITLSRIEIPTRGKHCKHLQCFDLHAYLQVMQNMSTFNARWKCPECPLIVKPKDLVIDGYVLQILKTLPIDISAVELDTAGNYKGLAVNRQWKDCIPCTDLNIVDDVDNTPDKSNVASTCNTRIATENDAQLPLKNRGSKSNQTDELQSKAYHGFKPSSIVDLDKIHKTAHTSGTTMSPMSNEIIVLDSSDDEIRTNETHGCIRHAPASGGNSSTPSAISHHSEPTVCNAIYENRNVSGDKENYKECVKSPPSTLSQRLNRLPQVPQPSKGLTQPEKRGVECLAGQNNNTTRVVSTTANAQMSRTPASAHDSVKRTKPNSKISTGT